MLMEVVPTRENTTIVPSWSPKIYIFPCYYLNNKETKNVTVDQSCRVQGEIKVRINCHETLQEPIISGK